jgi:hypothetical protein
VVAPSCLSAIPTHPEVRLYEWFVYCVMEYVDYLHYILVDSSESLGGGGGGSGRGAPSIKNKKMLNGGRF